MLAPIIAAPGRVELVDEPTPELQPGYALVDVRACGLCGTELSLFRGAPDRAFPVRRIGHECAGVIAAVGPGVDAFPTGDAFPAYLPGGRQRSVDAIERRLLPLERLVTAHPLERTQSAFEDMAAGRVFKPVIIPN